MDFFFSIEWIFFFFFSIRCETLALIGQKILVTAMSVEWKKDEKCASEDWVLRKRREMQTYNLIKAKRLPLRKFEGCHETHLGSFKIEWNVEVIKGNQLTDFFFFLKDIRGNQ